MKFRNLTIFAFCALAVSPSFASRDKGKKIKVSKDQFITELMGKMTLDEKIGQLVLPDGHGMTTGISEETDLYGDIKKGLERSESHSFASENGCERVEIENSSSRGA